MLADRSRWSWYLGLTAAVLLLLGSGWYQAFDIAPYYQADEQAHAGYVMELHHGRLPTIDTKIDADSGGWILQQRVKLTPDRNDDIWVANNPPLAYVVAAPAAALTRALGWPGGPLLGLRLTNVAFFALTAVFVGRLGRRLSGGDTDVGILSAAVFAAVPHVAGIGGAGYIDGIALLCSVALLDTLVDLTQAGPTRRQVITLAAWCTLGVGVRPMTAAFAGVAAAGALAIIGFRQLRRRLAPADGGAPVGAPGVVWSALVIGVPTLLVNGWYYLRNRRLYGDVTGSERLFEKFDRTARDLPITDVWRHEVWSMPVKILFNRRLPLSQPSGEQLIWGWTYRSLLALLAITAGLVIADQVRARRRGEAPRTPAQGWIALAVLVVVVIGLTLQHWQGGGNIHPRYLLFGVVGAAYIVTVPLVRFRLRWLVVALVGGLLVLQADEIPEMNRSIQSASWLQRAPRELGSPLGPDWLRFAGVPVMVLGVIALLVAVVAVGRTPAKPVEPPA